MVPLCCWTMVRQMARPRPVPPFWRASEGSTCWKRSKMVSSLSAGMPRPSSTTLRRRSRGRLRCGCGRWWLAGENLMAFERRLVRTWRMRSGSPSKKTASRGGERGSSVEVDVGGVGHGGHGVDGLLGEVAEGAAADVQRGAAGLHALEVEDVVDEADEAVGVGDGDAEEVVGFGVDVADEAGGEQAEGSADAGERGAELVGDGGDELVLDGVELGALGEEACRWCCALAGPAELSRPRVASATRQGDERTC